MTASMFEVTICIITNSHAGVIKELLFGTNMCDPPKCTLLNFIICIGVALVVSIGRILPIIERWAQAPQVPRLPMMMNCCLQRREVRGNVMEQQAPLCDAYLVACSDAQLFSRP